MTAALKLGDRVRNIATGSHDIVATVLITLEGREGTWYSTYWEKIEENRAYVANGPHAIALTRTKWFDIYSLLESHADELRNLATYCYDNAVARAYMIAKADEAAELADEINRGLSRTGVTL